LAACAFATTAIVTHVLFAKDVFARAAYAAYMFSAKIPVAVNVFSAENVSVRAVLMGVQNVLIVQNALIVKNANAVTM